MRSVLAALVTALLASPVANSCSCRPTMLEGAFSFARIVFRGTVDFDNDDASGTFAQQTLIGFKVSEVFKGLPAGTDHVWIDPGSLTSCYAEYHWGKEYLVFANGPFVMPAFVTRPKRLPEEFRSLHPPQIYFAPECSGTRETGYPGFAADQNLIREFARGKKIPPVVGKVYFSPDYPWMETPKRSGVAIALHVGNEIWRTETDPEGKFFFDHAPPAGAAYDVTASYPGMITAQTRLWIDSSPCSWVYVGLDPIGTIEGQVLRADGSPLRGASVRVWRASAPTRSDPFSRFDTDANGAFHLDAIPREPVRVAVFPAAPNRAAASEPPIVYPQSIIVDARGRSSPLVIRLPEPPNRLWVTIHAQFSDDAPAAGAHVRIEDDLTDGIELDADRQGLVRALLVRGVQYRLQAWRSTQSNGPSHHMLSQSQTYTAGPSSPPTLILDHVRRYWDDTDL